MDGFKNGIFVYLEWSYFSEPVVNNDNIIYIKGVGLEKDFLLGVLMLLQL